MSYASPEDLVERAGLEELLQIADRDNDFAPDPDVIEAALTHADNLVNGYIAVKYRLPLTSVPDLVRTWAVSIARYWLHRDAPPDYVRQDYQDAIAALKDVARGLIQIPDAEGNAPASSGGTVMAGHPPPVFDCHGLRGWRT